MNRDDGIDLQLGWNLLFKLSVPYSTGSRQREIRDGWKQAPTIFFFLPSLSLPSAIKRFSPSLYPWPSFLYISPGYMDPPVSIRKTCEPTIDRFRIKKGKEDSAEGGFCLQSTPDWPLSYGGEKEESSFSYFSSWEPAQTQLSGGGVWKGPRVFILFENIT